MSSQDGPDASSEVPFKSLPASVRNFYTIDAVRRSDVTLEEKQLLIKMYGPNSKNWIAPRT